MSKVVEVLSSEEIKKVKSAILDLIEAEEADNISEACEILGFPKLKAHWWTDNDPLWAGQVRQAQQIKADRLENKLDNMNHPVALIFRLKKLRPEYRDTYRFDVTSEPLIALLKELKAVAKPPETAEIIEGEYKLLPDKETNGS